MEKIIEHSVGNKKIVEIVSDKIIIQDEQDALDLMVNVEYKHGTKSIIVKDTNITPDFFNLKSGIAGTILQKFSNYRCQLAIIGDFSRIESKAFRDFMYESNKTKQVLFLSDRHAALNNLG